MDSEDSKTNKPRVYRREEHSISRQNIDPDALKTMRRLMRHGYKAYLVGGSVRDLLLGKKPKDFDIATDATPRRVKALFRNCRIIGRRFKLAHIYFGNGKIFEVSTFRAAGEEVDGEPADEKELLITRDNVYGDEQSDALRRDVTINALFYALRSFSVIDYVEGMDDLKAGIVRVIGDPVVRFAEDPVRMIRVVRHAVRAGFRIDDKCRDAILKQHALVESCSEVRLYEELKKDLTSGYALEILQELSAHGILQHLIPELENSEPKLLFGKSLFARCLNRVDAAALESKIENVTAVLALFALFVALPDPVHADQPVEFAGGASPSELLQDCFPHLAVPRKERERIAHLLELWQYVRKTAPEDLNVKKLGKDALFSDLQMFFRFLNLERQADSLLDVLLAAPEHQKSRERNPKRDNRPRRNSGNRRPRRITL